MGKSDYAYAIGVIKAREVRLLDNSFFQRLLEAKDADGALQLLMETEYGQPLSELENIRDFETALNSNRAETLRTVRKLAPNPNLIDVFFLRYDFHNLKALLKSKYSDLSASRTQRTEISADGALLDMGKYSIDELKSWMESENFEELPEMLRDAVRLAASRYEETKDPQLIDLVIDKKMYEHLLSMVDPKSEPFLRNLLQIWIDSVNIGMFVRMRIRGRPRDKFLEAFIPGGKVPLDLFARAYNDTWDGAVGAFRTTEYAIIVEEGIRHWSQHNSTSLLDHRLNAHLMNWVRQAKYVTFGAEPLIGYIMAKEEEIKNLRIILVSKINKLRRELVEERLGDVY
ncbi:MAG: V-type ATP synthase subunit C [bacterium]